MKNQHCGSHREELNVFLLFFFYFRITRVSASAGYKDLLVPYRPADRPTPPRGARRIISQKGHPFRFRKPQWPSGTHIICYVIHTYYTNYMVNNNNMNSLAVYVLLGPTIGFFQLDIPIKVIAIKINHVLMYRVIHWERPPYFFFNNGLIQNLITEIFK